ncbi:hypothetical protein CDIK_1053 [Cucumispora dikerogammari]|nr:hypothetical protein CDIK_1053 [Cucumispora dikerogammari]
MLQVFGNLAIIFLPIFIYLPQLLKPKSRIPLSVSLLTILASLFQLTYALMYCRLNNTFSITLVLKNVFGMLLHFYLIMYKTPLISTLEEKIYYSNKHLFKYGIHSTLRICFTVFSCLSVFFIFVGGAYAAMIVGYISNGLDAFTYIAQILINKLNKRSPNLPIKAFEQSRFDTSVYKIAAIGHLLKGIWFLYTNIPYLLIFNECSLMALSAYIGFIH